MNKFKEYLNKILYSELEIIKTINYQNLANKFKDILEININFNEFINHNGLIDRNGLDDLPNRLSDQYPQKISGYEDALKYAYKNKSTYFFFFEDGNNIDIYEVPIKKYKHNLNKFSDELVEVLEEHFNKFIDADEINYTDISFKKFGNKYNSEENLGADINVIIPKIVWIINHHLQNNTNQLYLIDALKREIIKNDKKVYKSPRFYMYKKILKNLNINFKECSEEFLVFEN